MKIFIASLCKYNVMSSIWPLLIKRGLYLKTELFVSGVLAAVREDGLLESGMFAQRR